MSSTVAGTGRLVAMFGPPADPRYPRVNPRHPRNRGVDWPELARYAAGQRRTAPPGTVLFVKDPGHRVHAAWLPGVATPAISDELRGWLSAAAGPATRFLPTRVNDRPFWFIDAPESASALDRQASRFRRGDTGDVAGIEHHVWRQESVRGLGVFRIPEEDILWATASVVRTVEASGLEGIRFVPRGEVR